MPQRIEGDPWVSVVIQNPGPEEKLLGQHDRENDISFIPAFFEKESAQECFMLMPREKGHKYEIQAIPYRELEKQAAENGFVIFMLSGQGEIIHKQTPSP